MTEYVAIFLFFMVALIFGVGTLALSYSVQARIANQNKLSPYECGEIPIADARLSFPIRYYIIAMLFVIFDIEIVFLYPWALAFKTIGFAGFLSMLIFIALFLLAFVYAWRKGGLEWD